MLILTRRPGEKVFFTLTEALPAGTTLELLLSKVKGSQARFAIRAPISVVVDREEVYERKLAEKRNGNA